MLQSQVDEYAYNKFIEHGEVNAELAKRAMEKRVTDTHTLWPEYVEHITWGTLNGMTDSNGVKYRVEWITTGKDAAKMGMRMSIVPIHE